MSPVASFVSRNYMHTSIISSSKALHTIAQPQPRIMFSPRAVCQTAPTKDTRSVGSVRARLVHNLKAGARCVQDVNGADTEQSIQGRNSSRWRIPLFKQHIPFSFILYPSAAHPLHRICNIHLIYRRSI